MHNMYGEKTCAMTKKLTGKKSKVYIIELYCMYYHHAVDSGRST